MIIQFGELLGVAKVRWVDETAEAIEDAKPVSL